MMWKRQSTGGIQQLAEERKALAERYTIDAAEAQRREQLMAEAAAREAEERERRGAEAERERRAAELEARRVAEAEELARRAAEAEREREREAAEEEARRAAHAELERESAEQAELRAAREPQPVLVSRPDPPRTNSAQAVVNRESEYDPGGAETALEEEEPVANQELPIYRWFART